MNPKKFIHYTILILVLSIFSIASLNYFMNDYGLYDTNEEKRIYMDEKDSKYLLSLNYIPKNFDALLIGPSLSDSIDTKKIKKHKVYNLSMAGANISELSLVTKNVLKKKDIDFIIFCLDPYITKDFGIKSLHIVENEKISTLFSMKTLKINLKKVYYFLFPKKDDFLHSEWGYNRIMVSKDHNSTKEIVKRVKQIQEDTYDIVINQDAVLELQNLIKLFNDKNIKTIFYLHPVPYAIYSQDKYTKQYQEFRNLMKNIVGKKPFYDFNTPQYVNIRQDDSNYLDSGHLNEKGVELLTIELNKIIKENIK